MPPYPTSWSSPVCESGPLTVSAWLFGICLVLIIGFQYYQYQRAEYKLWSLTTYIYKIIYVNNGDVTTIRSSGPKLNHRVLATLYLQSFTSVAKQTPHNELSLVVIFRDSVVGVALTGTHSVRGRCKHCITSWSVMDLYPSGVKCYLICVILA